MAQASAFSSGSFSFADVRDLAKQSIEPVASMRLETRRDDHNRIDKDFERCRKTRAVLTCMGVGFGRRSFCL